MSENWMYYNHALIPTCAPHEKPNIANMKSKEFWENKKGFVFFARWTDNFDNSEFSDFWYCIRKAPFVEEELSSSSRKHIRQALRNCEVEKIQVLDNIDELYAVFSEACKRYELFDGNIEYSAFEKGCRRDAEKGRVYWAGKNSEGKIIGYFVVEESADYVEIISAKFHPEFLKLQVSDALYVTVLDYYLNNLKKKYVSSGARSLNHKTNTQEYKERHFGYQKAYCRLNIEYNPKIKYVILFLYFFRKLFVFFDKITMIHKINSVLKMEEIVRKQKKVKLHE